MRTLISSDSNIVVISVSYKFGSFISPIDNSSYTIGRTIPIKFTLQDYSGANITNAKPGIYIAINETPTWQFIGTATYKSGAYQYNFDTTKSPIPLSLDDRLYIIVSPTDITANPTSFIPSDWNILENVTLK
jgi:hypothetical protein